MEFSRRVARWTVALALGVFTAAPSFAQSAASSGQIVGHVTDGSGGAVAAAEVTVRSKDTNSSRQTKTDSAGRYALSLLPLSTYELVVSGGGFERAVREVVVTLGATATANVTLKVAGVTEDVEVGGAVDRAGTHSKSVLTDLQVQNLPATGRRLRSMFLLTPSTQIEPECGGFAISGQKGLFTNINVDGGDYTNTHWCGHVEFSPTFSLEALQEFQVCGARSPRSLAARPAASSTCRQSPGPTTWWEPAITCSAMMR
jgi:hypothetical protein